MKYYLAILITAITFASCQKEELPDPVIEYNVTFKVYCDSCDSYLSIDPDDGLPLETGPIFTADSLIIDTIIQGGRMIAVAFIDTDVQNTNYNAVIYVDDQLVATSYLNPDQNATFISGSAGYYLK